MRIADNNNIEKHDIWMRFPKVECIKMNINSNSLKGSFQSHGFEKNIILSIIPSCSIEDVCIQESSPQPDAKRVRTIDTDQVV